MFDNLKELFAGNFVAAFEGSARAHELASSGAAERANPSCLCVLSQSEMCADFLISITENNFVSEAPIFTLKVNQSFEI